VLWHWWFTPGRASGLWKTEWWGDVARCIWSSWCHCHSCFITIQNGLVPMCPCCPGKEAIKWVSVCVSVSLEHHTSSDSSRVRINQEDGHLWENCILCLFDGLELFISVRLIVGRFCRVKNKSCRFSLFCGMCMWMFHWVASVMIGRCSSQCNSVKHVLFMPDAYSAKKWLIEACLWVTLEASMLAAHWTKLVESVILRYWI